MEYAVQKWKEDTYAALIPQDSSDEEEEDADENRDDEEDENEN